MLTSGLPITWATFTALLCFVAGFGCGAMVILWRWNLSLTLGTPLPGGASAKVLRPAADAEEQASTITPADFEEAVKKGTADLLAMAKESGSRLSQEEAREQTIAAIRYIFPEL